MPIYKNSLVERYTKYNVKYPDATTMTARLTAVQTIMQTRYQAGQSPVYNAVEATRNILETHGVPAGLHGVYYAFAQELARNAMSHSGATLSKIVSGLKQKYVTAHNADPAILDAIVNVVIGGLPPY